MSAEPSSEKLTTTSVRLPEVLIEGYHSLSTLTGKTTSELWREAADIFIARAVAGLDAEIAASDARYEQRRNEALGKLLRASEAIEKPKYK